MNTKMKRLTALLLALVMVFCLAACSSSADTEETETEEVTEEAAEAEAVTEEAAETEEEPAQEDAAQEESADSAAYDTSGWEDIKFIVATADNENDYSSQCLQWFMEQVEERSGGKLTFQVYYGGTYCSLAEEYDNVSSGAIDMTLWNQSSNSDVFPMTAFIGLANGNQEALDMTNYLVYENSETSAIYEKYATEGNIKMLGYLPAGTSLFCSTSEITTFADFSGITFGTMLNAALWESLGFNVVSCAPADMYESLSRGVVDSVCQAFPAAISRMFYEVTDYAMLTSYSAVCYNFLFNLDKWNSLSSDQQALLEEVMDDLYDYSLGLYDELQSQWTETWESATGNAIVNMSEEDAQLYIENSYKMNYQTYSAIAENLGQAEDFEVIADAVNEYLGIDCRADVE